MDTKDTFDRPAQTTRKDGQRENLPATRALELAESTASDAADESRLQMAVSVGKKGETKEVSPDDIESLRPSASEMKNG